MKHLIKIFFFTMMLVLFSTALTAQALTPISGTLSKVDRNNKDKPSKGQRTPSLPIAYTISQEEGLQIISSSISVDDIIEFEIWESEGDFCLSNSTDECSFVTLLFSVCGDIQIRLIAEDYILVGYVSTDI